MIIAPVPWIKRWQPTMISMRCFGIRSGVHYLAFRIAGQEHGDAATQLKRLGWVILARATTRRCFGMATLGILEIQDTDLMAARYKSERYQFIQLRVQTLPKWLPFALLALSLCMMALSHWHWNRAQARASWSAVSREPSFFVK